MNQLKAVTERRLNRMASMLSLPPVRGTNLSWFGDLEIGQVASCQ